MASAFRSLDFRRGECTGLGLSGCTLSADRLSLVFMASSHREILHGPIFSEPVRPKLEKALVWASEAWRTTRWEGNYLEGLSAGRDWISFKKSHALHISNTIVAE